MELRFEHITKHYGAYTALQDINLSLTEGIYGILGPNGAGKSTLMNILTGNMKPSQGHVTLDGEDVAKLGERFRRRVGYCPQQQTLYPSFTPWQFLAYLAALHGLEKQTAARRAEELLCVLSLADVKDQPTRTLSGGMKQRLMLAQALLHEPDILVLDEPTAGLDPRQRIAVRNLIGEVALRKIVLLSTHVVQDVEFIAQELLLLNHGVAVRQGTPAALTGELEGRVWETEVPPNRLGDLEAHYTICGVSREGANLRVRLLSAETPPGNAAIVRPGLEDVYLYFFKEDAAL